MRLLLLVLLCCCAPLISPSLNAAEDPTPSTVEATETAGENMAEEEENALLKLFHDGGWPMYVLAFLSVAALGLILERLVNLNGGAVAPTSLVKNL